MHLLAIGPSIDRNDRFPFPFIYLKLDKGTSFGRTLPVWGLIEREYPWETMIWVALKEKACVTGAGHLLIFLFFFFSHRPRVIKISSFALKTDFDPLFVLLLLSYFEAFEHNCLAINFWVSGFSLKGFIKNMNISFGGILFTLIRCSFFCYRIEKFLF